MVKAEIPSRLGNSPKYLAAAELGSAFVGAQDGGLEKKLEVVLDPNHDSTETKGNKIVILFGTQRNE